MNNTNDDGSASASLQLAAESASPAAAASGAAVVETATTPHRSSSSLIPPTFYEDDCLLTPLSHNRGWVGDDGVVVPASSSSMAVTENSNSNINIIGVAAPPVVLATNSNDDDTTDDAIIIPPLMILSGNEEIMELVINNNGNNIDNIHNNYSEEEDDAVLKTYTRKLSALSGCTPTTSGSENCNEDSPSSMSNTKNNNNNAGVASNNEGEEEEYDTPRFSSSLSFVENKKRQPLQQQPQQQQPQILTMEDMEINRVERSLGDSGGGGGGSCTTSQAVIVGDDEVTETSFTTMTTVGGGGGGSSNGDSMVEFGGGGLPSPPVMTEQHQFTYPQQQQQQYLQQRTSLPSLLLSSRRGGGGGGSSGGSRNGVRSPRPPRRMRAVDWCPNNSIVGGGGGGSGMSGSNNNSLPSSDKTAASTRAVRLGDDATVTTFATMTTMGDAGSTTLLLEGEMIEDGTATAASSDDEMLHEGEEEEEEDDEMEEEEEKEENQSMMLEDVKEENIVGAFVVDKIPRSSYKRKQQVRMQQQQLSKQTSLSGTTTRAVRGSTYDDQYSVVTFATMTTVGGGGMGIEDDNDQDVVDKVPSLLASTTTDTTSIVTNDTVLMGDNRSLATWATTNTMGGQLTGNVIDHVPSSMDNGVPSSLSSSSNVTIGTSNAVNDDPSIMTFTTSAADDISDINEMVDKIPTFAGGGRGNGRSIASGLTSQAVFERKMIFSGGDDRSVTSFATMTTMGDLGSIVETAEDLEDDEVDISNSSFFQLRPRAFMNHDIIDRRSAVVDVIPEAASSVASDTTNHSIGASVTTFGTMTTAGGRAERDAINNENDNSAVVDHVPNFSVGGDASIISGTTNHAIRSNDDQSVATWLTSTTSGVAAMLGSSSMRDQNIVDEIPSFNEDQSEEGGTNRAVRDAEDQSVVTWNTMTTAAIGGGSYLPGPYAVDRLPSFSSKWSSLAGASMSGTTNHRVGGGDDQSVVTFATVTTIGGDRGNEGLSKNNMVDKVPSFASSRIDARSIITDETVQMGDNQSLMTWATTNTMGGQLTGNVVDHVPAADISASSSDHVEIDEEDVTLGTTNAVKDDPSVTTFTTSAMSGGAVSCIDEVVDRIPTFAGGSGQSVTSGITYQAVRMGDDRSLASFATMATTGYDPGNSYESDVLESSSSSNSNSRRSYPNNDHIVDKIPSSSTTISTERTDFAVRLGDDMTEATFATVTTAGEGGQSSVKYPRSDQIVDQIPSSSTSVVSGRTSDAVRLGDDLTEATFATVTSVVVGNDVPTTTYPGVEENTDVLSRSSSSVRSQIAAATPTTGILRESRHGRPPSALRSAFESVTAEPNDPIDLGESVSNTHILRAIADLRFHVDYRIGDLREVNRRDSERGN
jgi:hypothetical protein